MVCQGKNQIFLLSCTEEDRCESLKRKEKFYYQDVPSLKSAHSGGVQSVCHYFNFLVRTLRLGRSLIGGAMIWWSASEFVPCLFEGVSIGRVSSGTAMNVPLGEEEGVPEQPTVPILISLALKGCHFFSEAPSLLLLVCPSLGWRRVSIKTSSVWLSCVGCKLVWLQMKSTKQQMSPEWHYSCQLVILCHF